MLRLCTTFGQWCLLVCIHHRYICIICIMVCLYSKCQKNVYIYILVYEAVYIYRERDASIHEMYVIHTRLYYQICRKYTMGLQTNIVRLRAPSVVVKPCCFNTKSGIKVSMQEIGGKSTHTLCLFLQATCWALAGRFWSCERYHLDGQYTIWAGYLVGK